MKRLMIVLMAVALVALPTMAQSFSSKRSVDNDQQAAQSFSTTEPFRSTSAMQTSGSVYSANPMLNEDGMASYGETGKPDRSIRKKTMDEPSNPGTPGVGESEQPVGDEMVPLLIISMLYVGYLLLRRRKTA